MNKQNQKPFLATAVQMTRKVEKQDTMTENINSLTFFLRNLLMQFNVLISDERKYIFICS